MPLTPVDKALDIILQAVPRLQTQPVALSDCVGRVLREDIVSTVDVPPADNSAMDGYALSSAHFALSMPLVARIAAGETGAPLPAGGCARIFTGAELPAGADTVVMQEDCRLDDGSVYFERAPSQGQHVRPRGQDMAAGERILIAGQRLSPSDIAVAAAAGITELAVSPLPKVALLSTGDELVEPGQVLAAGQIYNSNRYLLSALLRSLGAEVIDGGIVPDNYEGTVAALAAAATAADVVVTTGGVSAGEEDYVRPAMEQLGKLNLWKLAIKPGKPLAWGAIDDTPLFGLPGNPASSFVTFLVVVRPYLLAMQGATDLQPPQWPVLADFEWPRKGKRREYLRARLTGSGGQLRASLYPNQSSGVLRSASWANALVVLEAGDTVSKGDTVTAIPLDSLIH